MDRETMTNEENYAFDLTGYLHIPGVLTRPEIVRLNDAIDRAGSLEGHARLGRRFARTISRFY